MKYIQMDGNALRRLHARRLTEKEHYEVAYGKKSIMNDGDFYFLGMIWEAYGDLLFYKNKKTGETVSYFSPIGD